MLNKLNHLQQALEPVTYGASIRSTITRNFAMWVGNNIQAQIVSTYPSILPHNVLHSLANIIRRQVLGDKGSLLVTEESTNDDDEVDNTDDNQDNEDNKELDDMQENNDFNFHGSLEKLVTRLGKVSETVNTTAINALKKLML